MNPLNQSSKRSDRIDIRLYTFLQSLLILQNTIKDSFLYNDDP